MGYVFTRDARLLGARHLVQVSTYRVAISCRHSRRIVVLNTATGAIAGASAALDAEPGALVLVGGKLWCVCADGQVRRLSAGDTPAVEETIDVDAPTAAWIAADGTTILVPAGPGGVVALDTDGDELARLDDLIPGAPVWAIVHDGHLYAFNGRGRGAVLAISNAGALAEHSSFAAPAVQDIVAGYVDDDDVLHLACGYRASVVEFDLADPLEVAAGDTTRYPGFTLRGILSDGSILTAEQPDDLLDLPRWWPATGGIIAEAPVIVHGDNAAVSTWIIAAPTASITATPDGTDVDLVVAWTIDPWAGPAVATIARAASLPAWTAIMRKTTPEPGSPGFYHSSPETDGDAEATAAVDVTVRVRGSCERVPWSGGTAQTTAVRLGGSSGSASGDLYRLVVRNSLGAVVATYNLNTTTGGSVEPTAGVSSGVNYDETFTISVPSGGTLEWSVTNQDTATTAYLQRLGLALLDQQAITIFAAANAYESGMRLDLSIADGSVSSAVGASTDTPPIIPGDYTYTLTVTDRLNQSATANDTASV